MAFPVESTGSAADSTACVGCAFPAVRVPGTGRQQRGQQPVQRHHLRHSGPARKFVAISGQRIPLLDLDRQSMIVRLGGMDCRIAGVVSAERLCAWYAALESPTNSPAIISGRRLVVGAGLLDRLPDVLPGNIVCRAHGRR